MTRIGTRLPGPLVLGVARRVPRCLFVLSTGRVGTQTLTALLGLGSGVRAEHEPGPRLLEETFRAYREPQTEASLRSSAERYAGARFGVLASCALRRHAYVETSNRLTYLTPALAEHLPNARFVFLHRHPAAVVRSAMRRRWYAGAPWDRYRITPRSSDPFASRWSSMSLFEKCCWNWRAVNELALSEARRLGETRLRTLGSDALFSSQDLEGKRRLFDWLGVPFPPAEAIVRVLDARLNEESRGDFPKWEDWSPEQRSILREIAGEVAAKLGYDLG